MSWKPLVYAFISVSFLVSAFRGGPGFWMALVVGVVFGIRAVTSTAQLFARR